MSYDVEYVRRAMLADDVDSLEAARVALGSAAYEQAVLTAMAVDLLFEIKKDVAIYEKTKALMDMRRETARVYTIILDANEGSTRVTMLLTVAERELLDRLATLTAALSTCDCEPVLSVEPCEKQEGE